MKVKKPVIIMLTANERYKLRFSAVTNCNKINAYNGSFIKFAAII